MRSPTLCPRASLAVTFVRTSVNTGAVCAPLGVQSPTQIRSAGPPIDAGIMVETGGHGLLTFRRQDLIVVSPGVPYDTPELKQVRAFGLPIIGELELASRLLRGRIEPGVFRVAVLTVLAAGGLDLLRRALP